MGFPEEASKYVFPANMFLAQSDLTPIKENIDKIVYGLTKWESKIKAKKVVLPEEKMTIHGKDHEEAFANVNELFYKNLWTDGLPIVPPTKDRVNWMMEGTDFPPDNVVAPRIQPAGGIATVKKIAVNAVMAGARPEYMPVIIAAVEAMVEPPFKLPNVQATTNPVTPLLIINGPIRKQLDINSSSGFLGPGWQANATIGRTIRLIMINLGGAFPLLTSKSTAGQPGRYTLCMAENEEALPQGWVPFHVDRGFDKNANTVTVFPAQDIKKTGYGGLTAMAEGMKTATQYAECVEPGEVLAIFSPDDIKWVVEGVNVPPTVVPPYTNKDEVRKFLFENSRRPWESVLRGHAIENYLHRDKLKPGGEAECLLAYKGGMVPIVRKWDKIYVLVAGGVGLHSISISGYPFSQMVTKEIRLPSKWNDLLEKAKAHVRPPL